MKTTTELYPKKGGKSVEEAPDELPDAETLYCDRCTSAVERLIQCEKCEMYLYSSCEKIPESVMATTVTYTGFVSIVTCWFVELLDKLVQLKV